MNSALLILIVIILLLYLLVFFFIKRLVPKKTSKIEKIKIYVEVFTIISTFFLVIFAFWSSFSADKTVQIMRDDFIQTNRPYVFLEGINSYQEGILKVHEGVSDSIWISFTLINTGNSVAKEVKLNFSFSGVVTGGVSKNSGWSEEVPIVAEMITLNELNATVPEYVHLSIYPEEKVRFAAVKIDGENIRDLFTKQKKWIMTNVLISYEDPLQKKYSAHYMLTLNYLGVDSNTNQHIVQIVTTQKVEI